MQSHALWTPSTAAAGAVLDCRTSPGVRLPAGRRNFRQDQHGSLNPQPHARPAQVLAPSLAKPALDHTALPHDRRGLLTHAEDAVLPEFGITLPQGSPPQPLGQVMPDTRDPTCIRPSHTGVGQAGERVRGRLSVSGSWIALPPPQRRSWTVRTSSSGSCWPVKSSCSRQSGCPSCGSCAASLVCT